MFESKYSKVLTILLVIVIIAIVGLLGFLAYDYYQNYAISTDAKDFVDNFQGEISDTQNTTNTDNTTGNVSTEDPFNAIETTNTSGSGNSSTSKPTYKGFGMLGTLEIPAIDFEYPVLEKVTPKSIETAVAFSYGVGLNQPGNTVIVGHNYRNGLFFSNNKRLQIGDKLYVTDLNKNRLSYTIYNKFETDANDASFYQRDTGGVPEVTLSTCTDDSSARLIIFARADG